MVAKLSFETMHRVHEDLLAVKMLLDEYASMPYDYAAATIGRTLHIRQRLEEDIERITLMVSTLNSAQLLHQYQQHLSSKVERGAHNA